jgi:serine/threonine protein phosphatase PrpC
MITPIEVQMRSERRRMVRDARQVLLRHGELRWMTGLLRRRALAIAMHSDYGPTGQDKDRNQDCVIAWCGSMSHQLSLRWIIAMADGVSSSHRGEWGAELACWASAADLLTSGETSPHTRALSAVQAATRAIEQLATVPRHAPETSLPNDEFPATWRYTLERGLFFQTTLSLAWSDGQTTYLAAIGDGGAVYITSNGGSKVVQRLSKSDLTTDRVRCLGPQHDLDSIDTWLELTLRDGDLLALYTDGIDRGMTDSCVLQTFLERHGAFQGNAARALIEHLVATSPSDYFDNLTLALVTIGSDG